VTTPDTGHASYDELAVGYALSALEPDDEQQFVAHLRGCAVCARALAEHTETLAHLAYAAEAETPPPSVLEGIRAGVAASGRAGAFPAPLSLDAARQRRSRSTRLMTATLGAAAAVALIVGLVFVRGLMADRDNQQTVNDRLAAAVRSLTEPNARLIDLKGDGGHGTLILNGQNVSLVMAGMPRNDTKNSVYVLWEQTTFGDVSAVGVFDVKDDDLAVATLQLKQDPTTVHAFMVTKESGRVAPPRTTQPVLVAGEA
jgi:anti-sigma-K factor RskA